MVRARGLQAGRPRLRRPAMEAFYQLPFERFERYCPYGTAEDVADFLTRYVDAGCTEFNLFPQSPDEDAAGISSFPILSRFSRPAPRAREHRCGYTRNCIRIRLALCGPDRRSGDGLRICVGPVPGTVLLRPRPPGSAFGVRPAANTRIDS